MNHFNITLDKNTPIPLYYQLKEGLLNNIKSGRYPQESMIPKEQDLCDQLGISRTTVRQAISELVHEGWLYRVKSKGTFVARPKINQDFVKKLESYNDQIRRLSMIPSTRVLEVSQKEADDIIAANLNIAKGDDVLFLHRIRYADQEAIVTIRTYLPYKLCQFVQNCNFEEETLYHVLSQKEETKVVRAHRTIEAVEATSEDARYMDIKQGKAIQLFHTVGYNSFGEPIEYSVARYRGDRSIFDVNIYVENEA